MSEDTLAGSLLLTVDDFPAGWVEKLTADDDDEDDGPLSECETGDPVGRTGRAQSGDFSVSSDTIQHGVSVFGTTENANAALAQIEPRAECLVELINGGDLDTDEAEFSNATMGRGAAPEVGTTSLHIRIQFHVKAKGQVGFGSEVDAFWDIAAWIDGRVGSSLATTAVLTPFNSALLSELTGIAAERISLAE